MAIFRRQRSVSAQLVLDLAAVTTSSPFGRELAIVVVDLVWLSVFPFILLAVGGSTRLELMGLVCCTSFLVVNVLINSALIVMFVRHGYDSCACKRSTVDRRYSSGN